MPSVSATIVGPRPAAPTTAFSTRSGLDWTISSRTPSSPASTWPPHAEAARSADSGSASATAGTPCSTRLLEQALPARVRREAGDLQVVARPDHVDRLGADRPGRSEYRTRFTAPQCRCRPKCPVNATFVPRNEDGRPEGLPSSHVVFAGSSGPGPPRARTAGPSGRRWSPAGDRDGVLAALRGGDDVDAERPGFAPAVCTFGLRAVDLGAVELSRWQTPLAVGPPPSMVPSKIEQVLARECRSSRSRPPRCTW